MLFTVAYGYFYTVSQDQAIYQKNVKLDNTNFSLQAREDLLLTGAVSGNTLSIVVNNTGITTDITEYWVMNSTTAQSFSGTTSNPVLPVELSTGQSVVFKGISYTPSSHYLIKVLTARGSVFTTIYPASPVNLASTALASGAIGDLYLQPSTYTYYEVVSCSTSSSGYCLQREGAAFTIPSSFAGSSPMAFSVTITDLAASQDNITLDQNSLIEDFMAKGDSFYQNTWYVVTNQSANIANTYAPIVLNYNVPTVVVFASGTPGTFGLPSAFTQSQIQGKLASVFILSHGWKGISYSQISSTAANYGQNSPYVTTLYS